MWTHTGDTVVILSSLSVTTPPVCGGEYGEYAGNDFCENRRSPERDTGDQGMDPVVEEINGQGSRDSVMHPGPHRSAGPSHDRHTGHEHDTTSDRVGCPRSGPRLWVQSHIHGAGARHPGGTANGDIMALPNELAPGRTEGYVRGHGYQVIWGKLH